MKRAALIIIGSLGILFALWGIVGFIGVVGSYTVAENAEERMDWIGAVGLSVAMVAVGLLACVVCFQRAFRKPK